MRAETAPADGRASIGWLVSAAVAGLALAVRLVHLWQIRTMPLFAHLVGDAHAFDVWAQEIVAGNWLGNGVFYQAPLYPYFLAGIYAVAGRNLIAVRVVQAGLGAAACVLLAHAGARVFGRRVGLLAAVLLAVWPSAVFGDGIVQKSSVETVLFCGFLLAVTRAAVRPRSPSWFAMGLVLGTLVLIREWLTAHGAPADDSSPAPFP